MIRLSDGSKKMVQALFAMLLGLLFSVGLALAGMTQPAKVVGFLDVAGNWDPSLAFVILGAIAVYAVAHRLSRRRSEPLLGQRFHLPTRRDMDPKLVVGSGLFGIGWGLSGYCPGPALASLGAGAGQALWFVAAMALGMLLFDALEKLGRPLAAPDHAAPAERPTP